MMKFNLMPASIRIKLLAAFVLLTSLTGGLIGLVTYLNWERSSENEAIQLSRQVLFSKRNYMESYLEERVQSMIPIWFHPDVQHLIQGTEAADPLAINRISGILQSEMQLKEDISAILLYSEDGRVIHYSKEKTYRIGQANPLPIPHHAIPLILSPHIQDYYYQGEQVISIVRGITVGGSTIPQYYLNMDIRMSVFRELIAPAIWGKEYVVIVDPAGNYVYHPDSYRIGRPFDLHNWKEKVNEPYFFADFQNKKVLFSSLKGEVSGWTYFSIIPYGELRKDIIANRNMTLAIIGGLLVAAILAAVIIATRITKPLIELKRVMLKLEQGNFSVSLPVRSLDELGYLTLSFNRMVERLQCLTEEVYISRINETEAALKRLQAQINPHFLYNTLDAIQALASMEGIRPIQRIAISLSQLFRYNISEEDRLVPLKKEIKYIKIYLDIQHVRFENRFRTIIHVDPDLENMPILKFILQPLVENAFTHGLEPKTEYGCIWLSVIREKGKVLVRVTDNGVGMTADQLRQLKAALADPAHAAAIRKGRGIGLANVHQRLKLHYGERYEMAIESEAGSGTTIEIRLDESVIPNKKDEIL